jgi:hypothetical protein
MNYTDYNPWWKEKEVKSELVGIKRNNFEVVSQFMDDRQILILKGLRRVGKTTLVYQLIDSLIRGGVSPFDIFYYSLDQPFIDIQEAIDWYKKNVAKDFENKRVYIFLDEIQKENFWTATIKQYYDIYPNIKWVLTGSVTLDILGKANESLAGRFFSFLIEPIDFSEYLDFISFEYDIERFSVYEEALNSHLFDYLRTGGFIEAIGKNSVFIQKYFLESLIGRIISQDINNLFSVQKPDLLAKLFQIISISPGMLINYQNLSNDFSCDVRTLENYIGILEKSFLIRKMYNYSKNQISSERKLKRAYPYSPAFSIAFQPNRIEDPVFISILIETLAIKNCRYFFRYKEYETDGIFTNVDSVLPVEVKYREKIQIQDLKGLMYFMKKFDAKSAIVITKNLLDRWEIDGLCIDLIPVIQFLINKSNIEKGFCSRL